MQQESERPSTITEKFATLRPNNFQEDRTKKRGKNRTIAHKRPESNLHNIQYKTHNRFQQFDTMNNINESNTNKNTTNQQNKSLILHFVEKIRSLVHLLKSVITNKEYNYEILNGNLEINLKKNVKRSLINPTLLDLHLPRTKTKNIG